MQSSAAARLDELIGVSSLLDANTLTLAEIVGALKGQAAADAFADAWRGESADLVSYARGQRDSALADLESRRIAIASQLATGTFSVADATSLLQQREQAELALVDSQDGSAQGMAALLEGSDTLGRPLAAAMAAQLSDLSPQTTEGAEIDMRLSLVGDLQSHLLLTGAAIDASADGRAADAQSYTDAASTLSDRFGSALAAINSPNSPARSALPSANSSTRSRVPSPNSPTGSRLPSANSATRPGLPFASSATRSAAPSAGSATRSAAPSASSVSQLAGNSADSTGLGPAVADRLRTQTNALVSAAAGGDRTQAAQDIDRTRADLDALLSGANQLLPPGLLAQQFRASDQPLLTAADAFAARDYPTAFARLHEAMHQVQKPAETIAEAIVDRYPARFLALPTPVPHHVT
jgi:hypothetical protein